MHRLSSFVPSRASCVSSRHVADATNARWIFQPIARDDARRGDAQRAPVAREIVGLNRSDGVKRIGRETRFEASPSAKRAKKTNANAETTTRSVVKGETTATGAPVEEVEEAEEAADERRAAKETIGGRVASSSSFGR